MTTDGPRDPRAGRSDTRVLSRPAQVQPPQRVALSGSSLTIGRDPDNDLVLADPRVSRFHAQVGSLGEGSGAVVMDLGSLNGTRVNGRVVERARLGEGDRLGVGPYTLVLDEGGVVARDERASIRLDATEIEVVVGDRRILQPLSVSLEPGELVALIGASGAGKSTLLKTMAGVRKPSAGHVTVNGEPLASRKPDIAYVPQDDSIHALLTVRETLAYAARLRLPDDASRADIDEAVERVIGEMSLGEQAETRIESLSGGQRKRAAVGVELVNRPGILFLDEPTSGLDPVLETRVMELLRHLADGSRAVAVVTHATGNLSICDRLVVMARGGELAFEGPPEAALEFFGVDQYDGIYVALEGVAPGGWAERRDGRPSSSPRAAPQPAPSPGAEPATMKRRRLGPQLRVLVDRYVRLLARDRRNLLILVGQVPLLALAVVGLFKSGVFNTPGRPGDAVALVFLLLICTIWLGSLAAARELVRERTVFVREAAVGVRVGAYLTSKVAVLFALAVFQAVVLTAIVVAFHPLRAPPGTYLAIFGLTILTAFVSVGMGLLISAAVASDDQAISITPLAIIPQLLFAGSQVPVERMTEPVAALSNLVFGRWALSTIGTSLDFNDRFAASPEFAAVNRFGTDFFAVSEAAGAAILCGFLGLFIAATALLLRRRAASFGQ